MRPAHFRDPLPLKSNVSPPPRRRARARRLRAAGSWAARGALLLLVAAGTSARALDVWLNTPIVLAPNGIDTTGTADCTQPPGLVTCQDNDWVLTCEADYGSTDPNDTVNNPCLAPQAPSGQSFVEQAQAAASSPAATSESVFIPSGSLQPLTPLGAAAPATDRFAAAVPSPSRAVMEAAYGPMSLQNTNPASVTSWANQELIAQYNAWNTRGLNPLTYQRYTNTAEYFDPIPTCENYVYRSFRDIEVWIDGINACGSLPEY